MYGNKPSSGLDYKEGSRSAGLMCCVLPSDFKPSSPQQICLLSSSVVFPTGGFIPLFPAHELLSLSPVVTPYHSPSMEGAYVDCFLRAVMKLYDDIPPGVAHLAPPPPLTLQEWLFAPPVSRRPPRCRPPCGRPPGPWSAFGKGPSLRSVWTSCCHWTCSK